MAASERRWCPFMVSDSSPCRLPGVDLGVRDIIDVTPTLLALLGLPVPADVDGRVMREALSAQDAALPVADRAVTSAAPVVPALTAEEEAALARSLRSLGYLE